ncbi:enoyl-CoA hydratase/isomerase family protein [Mycobacterium sp. shizuoka-1]|jgi:enoyl-CoA hydratase|uniref:enoyl-CoA hydratase/isomerase family protein n=1 Tax=Mycobacterium sp. shizuoka-1 TaxID=2039281 RepID=UPI000C05F484|nr:enoyl-CoA hydratase/isomerase family protein [Mycobacterium sp. shizuoka-1]GAY15804.1 enoyl-CoA hydratase [Mycobacterium sp. shizuoka-1]
MTNSSDAVGYELRGPVAWLRLQRPEKMNAIDPDVLSGLTAGLARALSDDARAVALTGTGAVFCAGADLEFIFANAQDVTVIAHLLEASGQVMRTIARHPTPVIAAVNGTALAGGFELVLACDLVVAAETATLGDGHAKFGLFPGAGGSIRLPRLVGANRARELMFTGRSATAAEMRDYGVVSQVVPDDELDSVVQKLGEQLARTSALALARMKRVVNEAADLPLDEALALELKVAGEHLASPDVAEGLAAFAGGRRPSFPSTPKDLS